MNSARLLLLRAAMKKEELRLQSAANQVARIASGLEMEVAAKANIDASLTRLRAQLKQDAENMATMQRMADLAMSELSKKDDDLANKARGMNYTFQQMGSAAAGAVASAAGIAALTAAGQTANSPSALNLVSQFVADSAQKLGNLFDAAGDRIMEALQGVSLKDLAASGGQSGAGKSGMETAVKTAAAAAGAASATAIFMANCDKLMAPSASKSSGSKSSQKKSIWDKFRDAASDAGSWVAGKAEDAADAAKKAGKWVGEKAAEAGDWVADKAADAMDAVKDAGKWAGEKLSDAKDWASDTASDIWKGVKAVANSKPVEYLWDMGGSLLGGGTDVLSFCGNVATLQWADAGADVYSFVNNFFDFSQDAVALVSYGVGAGADAFGASQKTVDYFYSYAEDYAAREGLAGELHALGFDTFGYVVDATDFAVGTYKTVTGIQKMNLTLDSIEDGLKDLWKYGADAESLQTVKDGLFSLTGWKSVDSLTDAAELTDQIDHYKNFWSNVKLGYKYVDETFSEGNWLVNAAKTVVLNTSPGKAGDGILSNAQDYLDLLGKAAGAGSADSTASTAGAGSQP